MIEAATTTKKNQPPKVEPETKLTKVRKTKEFKPVHYIVIPLPNNDGIFRVKYGVESSMTELVEANSAFEAAERTSHPPKLGEGFVDFLISMSGCIDATLTVVRVDVKTKEMKITFESVKSEKAELETKPWNATTAMIDG